MKRFRIIYTNYVTTYVDAVDENEAYSKFYDNPSSFPVDSIDGFQDADVEEV